MALSDLSVTDLREHWRAQSRGRINFTLNAMEESLEASGEGPEFGIEGNCFLRYDIWRVVIRYVHQHEDIIALWETCPLFRMILGEEGNGRYIAARLPKVLKIILKRTPGKLIGVREFENDEDFFKAHGRPRKLRLSMKIQLLFREVSFACKTATEAILMKASENEVHIKLQTVLEVENLIEMSVDHRTMFPHFPDRLSIDFMGYGLSGPFIAAVGRLLDLAGLEIKTLSYRSTHEPGVMYQTLRDWVSKVPHIECLEMLPEHAGTWMKIHQKTIPKIGDVDPFPRCPKLKMLRMSRSLPEAYICHIRTSNPEILELFQGERRRLDVRFYAADLVQTPLLGRFHLLTSLSTPATQNILKARNLGLPLEKLTLFQGKENPEQRNCHLRCSALDVFGFVNQFGNTLVKVVIDLLMRNDLDQSSFLKLPVLTEFQWEHDETRFPDMSFLIYAQKLEIFRATTYAKAAILKEEAKAQTKAFYEKMNKGFTNGIWTAFPRLKEFVSEHYLKHVIVTFTRFRDDSRTTEMKDTYPYRFV